MRHTGSIAWMAAAVAALVLTGTAAWPATTKQPSIGIIDLQSVTEKAPRMMQYAEEIKAFAQAIHTDLDIRAENTLLTDDEVKELINLKTKPNPSAADIARIKALTAAEFSRDEELNNLRNAKNLDDKQKARMKELQEIQRKSEAAQDTVANDYTGKLRSTERDLRAKANDEIRAAASAVAKARGLTLVLAKNTIVPDGRVVDLVLIGGVDITDDIVAKLERK